MKDVDTGLHVRLAQAAPIPLDADFQCQPGEVVALVGPSGSGKSTLLRSIAGLYRPARGSITCNGESWFDTASAVDWPPQRRRVGMLFQDYALFPHLTALDNVRLALDAASRDAGRAQELLAQVHLQGLEQRLPHALSGGQQQRVALARALARDPRVLLLDEPFSAVDQVTRRKLRLEMAQMTRALAMPIILVTHDLDEAQMLADRIVVLHNGQTLQQGSPAQVMNAPLNATVARLVDARNLFEAEVIAQDVDGRETRIRWHGLELAANLNSGFTTGDEVAWCVSPADVLLHRRVQPSRGVKENPVRGTIVEMVTVGGITNVMLSPSVAVDERLHMDLPPHAVRRNGLEIGAEVGVSVLRRAIHLMPR